MELELISFLLWIVGLIAYSRTILKIYLHEK